MSVTWSIERADGVSISKCANSACFASVSDRLMGYKKEKLFLVVHQARANEEEKKALREVVADSILLQHITSFKEDGSIRISLNLSIPNVPFWAAQLVRLFYNYEEFHIEPLYRYLVDAGIPPLCSLYLAKKGIYDRAKPDLKVSMNFTENAHSPVPSQMSYSWLAKMWKACNYKMMPAGFLTSHVQFQRSNGTYVLVPDLSAKPINVELGLISRGWDAPVPSISASEYAERSRVGLISFGIQMTK